MTRASHDFRAFAATLLKCLVLVCVWVVCAPGTKAQVRAEVRVDVRSVQHPIDPRIHGHFMEHIARVIQQGLWAELLRNRKFYPLDPDHTQVADPWKPEADRTHVSYAVDPSTTLDGISSERITLFGATRAWRGISQSGFDVLGGKEYVAYAWIKADAAGRQVSFRLETAKGEAAAQGSATVRGDWQKYEVRLKPDRDLRPAVFRIAFNSPGVQWIGAASLMPTDNVDGMRRDVLEMFKLLGPTLFRWPGGCYADAYDWRKAIGPRDRRPPVPIIPLGYPNGYDHGMDPNDFGTDEFMRLCEFMGAEPFINANFGTGTPELEAAWVEYCNGPANSKWGAVRAANGHREPYGVKLWAIGNEVWGDPYESGHTTAEGYSTYYVTMARAMRAMDPTIRLTAVGGFDEIAGQEGVWNETVLKAAWQDIDYLSLHHYYPAGYWPPALMARPFAQYQAVVAEPTNVELKLRKTLAQIDRITQGRKKIQIAFDEWNEWDWDYPFPVPSPGHSVINQFIDDVQKSALEINQTMRDALFDARMMHNFMRYGDRVPIAVRTHPINSLATMRTDSTRVFMTASGKMMQLYRQHSGTSLVKTEAQAPTFDVPEEGWTGISYLDAVATLSADGRKLFVHMLNLHPSEALATHLHIDGSSVEPSAEVWQIAPQDFMSRNNFEITNVDITHAPLDRVTTDFVYNLPAHSATTVEISLK